MEQNQNPLIENLRNRLPGQTFRLPSLGYFYKNNELSEDVVNGELHVFPMTTIDEIVLNTPDKLLNGKGVEEVIKRCIPQVNHPDLLLSKDVDYLLACLRLVSYGPTIELTYKHSCENAKQHTYVVGIEPIIKQTKEIDPTIIQEKVTFVTPEGQQVKIKPISFKDVVQLYQSLTLNKNQTEDEMQISLIKNYATMIEEVDGVSDREMIYNWVISLPLSSYKLFLEKIDKLLTFGIDPTTKQVCKDCGEEIELSVPINPIGFFT